MLSLTHVARNDFVVYEGKTGRLLHRFFLHHSGVTLIILQL